MFTGVGVDVLALSFALAALEAGVRAVRRAADFFSDPPIGGGDNGVLLWAAAGVIGRDKDSALI